MQIVFNRHADGFVQPTASSSLLPRRKSKRRFDMRTRLAVLLLLSFLILINTSAMFIVLVSMFAIRRRRATSVADKTK